MINRIIKLRRNKLLTFLLISVLLFSMVLSAQAIGGDGTGGGAGSGTNPLNYVSTNLTTISGDTATPGASITDSNTVPADATFEIQFDKNVVSETQYNGKTVYANNQSCIVLQTSSGSLVSVNIFRLGTGDPSDPEKRNFFVKPNSNLISGHQYMIIISPDLIANNGLTMGYPQTINFTVQSTPSPAQAQAPTPVPTPTSLASSLVQNGIAKTVKADDGSAVSIPAGALPSTVGNLTITISKDTQTVNPSVPNLVGYDPVYTERTYGPSGTVFNLPVTLTLPFAGVNVDPADIAHLAVFLLQDGLWVKVGGVVDSVNKVISVNVSHFSTYRIMADRTTVDERIGGTNRYETAVKIANNFFTTGADTVVLTRGDISADALTAVPLARHYNAPLLLTPQDKLPDEVLNKIKALGTKTVYIVGGESAVSDQVSAVITGQGIKVQRAAGIDRYDTAYKVAELLGRFGEAIIVNGNDYAFPDALSVSSWAAYEGVPILYADGTNILPEITAKALSEFKVSRTILVGGTAVLPKSIEGLVQNPERYAGDNRYGTNIQVLSKLQPNPVQIFAATGNNFADALAGAAVAGQSNAWVILTGGNQTAGSDLTPEQQQLLQSAKNGVLDLHVFGGTAAVPDTILNELKKILGL